MTAKEHDNKRKMKFFEFPPTSLIMTVAGKTGLDLVKESITHPKATAGFIRKTLFGDKEKVYFTIVYGDTNQSRFTGPYSGNQCTSMSVAAIAWWFLGGDTGIFTTDNINLVLRMGHRLHQTLRRDYNLSVENDMRVSIDDFPKYLMIGLLGQVAVITRPGDDNFVVTSPNQNAEEFETLQTYLETWLEKGQDQPGGFLITISHYSNAIMYNNEGIWLWYDSHGYMRVNKTNCRKYASVIELLDVSDLSKFVIALRGPAKVCQIVPIACRSEGRPEDHILFGAADLPEITQHQIEELQVLDMSEEEFTPEPSNSMVTAAGNNKIDTAVNIPVDITIDYNGTAKEMASIETPRTDAATRVTTLSASDVGGNDTAASTMAGLDTTLPTLTASDSDESDAAALTSSRLSDGKPNKNSLDSATSTVATRYADGKGTSNLSGARLATATSTVYTSYVSSRDTAAPSTSRLAIASPTVAASYANAKDKATSPKARLDSATPTVAASEFDGMNTTNQSTTRLSTILPTQGASYAGATRLTSATPTMTACHAERNDTATPSTTRMATATPTIAASYAYGKNTAAKTTALTFTTKSTVAASYSNGEDIADRTTVHATATPTFTASYAEYKDTATPSRVRLATTTPIIGANYVDSKNKAVSTKVYLATTSPTLSASCAECKDTATPSRVRLATTTPIIGANYVDSKNKAVSTKVYLATTSPTLSASCAECKDTATPSRVSLATNTQTIDASYANGKDTAARTTANITMATPTVDTSYVCSKDTATPTKAHLATTSPTVAASYSDGKDTITTSKAHSVTATPTIADDMATTTSACLATATPTQAVSPGIDILADTVSDLPKSVVFTKAFIYSNPNKHIQSETPLITNLPHSPSASYTTGFQCAYDDCDEESSPFVAFMGGCMDD